MALSIFYLPDEIMAGILKRLPFSSMVQCRAVSKLWNSLIMSLCHFPKFPKPMLMGNHPVEGWSIRLYNSKSQSWVPVSLPFLEDASQSERLYLTASSGGLMCFETADRRNFRICNPITKQWRHLQVPVATDEFAGRACYCLNPSFCMHWPTLHSHDMPKTLTGLIVDEHTGNYKLIVASLDESTERRTFIYDSLEDSWTTGAKVPWGTGFVNPVALTVKGNLYSLIQTSNKYSCEKMVLKYDVKHDIWCGAQVGREIVPTFFGKNELELFEHRDGVKLLRRIVARPCRDGTIYCRSFYVNVYVLSVVDSSGGIEIVGSPWNRRRDTYDGIVERHLREQFTICACRHVASVYSATCV